MGIRKLVENTKGGTHVRARFWGARTNAKFGGRMKLAVRFAIASLAICGAVVAIPIEAPSASASATPITIGLITELSGGAASQYGGTQYGVDAI